MSQEKEVEHSPALKLASLHQYNVSKSKLKRTKKTYYSNQKQDRGYNDQQHNNSKIAKMERKTTVRIFQATHMRRPGHGYERKPLKEKLNLF